MDIHTGNTVKIIAILERQSKFFILVLGFALIGAIGVIDFLTLYELSLSAFYVLPISLITWFTNRRLGLTAAFISALVWLSADVATKHEYTYAFIPVWNTLIRLSFFVIISLLLSALRSAFQLESQMAREDYLTGAINSRFFYYLAQMEIDRYHRYGHPFTLAYFDLDNFKSVNDQFGHACGDQVLRTVASFIKGHVRKTDIIARLGGDEFALLLPETNQESACIAISNLQKGLLEEMQRNNWPITFSIGVLTYMAAPTSTDELVKMADDLMYSVKRSGKNAVRYSTYRE